jgi:hypothetical protein
MDVIVFSVDGLCARVVCLTIEVYSKTFKERVVFLIV